MLDRLADLVNVLETNPRRAMDSYADIYSNFRNNQEWLRKLFEGMTLAEYRGDLRPIAPRNLI